MADMRTQFEKDLPALVPAGFELPGRRPRGKVSPDRRELGRRGRQRGRDDRGAGRSPLRHVSRCDGEEVEITDGTVVIASITSCTNTSNPSVMVGAGLLAKKAVEKGLSGSSPG